MLRLHANIPVLEVVQNACITIPNRDAPFSMETALREHLESLTRAKRERQL